METPGIYTVLITTTVPILGGIALQWLSQRWEFRRAAAAREAKAAEDRTAAANAIQAAAAIKAAVVQDAANKAAALGEIHSLVDGNMSEVRNDMKVTAAKLEALQAFVSQRFPQELPKVQQVINDAVDKAAEVTAAEAARKAAKAVVNGQSGANGERKGTSSP